MNTKEPKKKLKIVVGTNCLTEVQYPAYTNHCQFWFRLGRSYPEIDFIFSNPSRMSIDRMRNMTAKVALESNADYILFLDDDVIVSPNYGLKQLLDCEADIAAGKINIRGYPFDYMCFEYDKTGGLVADKTLPKTGIVNKDAIGFSFALLKTGLLRRLQEPYFVTGLNHTEDIYYCLKARQVAPECTIKVNCDCECGHILWPEVLYETNRKNYTEYFKETNKTTVEASKNGSGPLVNKAKTKDRGQEYLLKVRKADENSKTEHRVR